MKLNVCKICAVICLASAIVFQPSFAAFAEESAQEAVSESLSGASAEEAVTGLIKIDANVRAFPSEDGEITGAISEGTTVGITGQSGSWYHIKYEDVEGYINKQLIGDVTGTVEEENLSTEAPAESEKASAEETVRGYVKANCKLRVSPDVDADISGSLSAGKYVNVIGQYEEWLHVQDGDVEGYVNENLVVNLTGTVKEEYFVNGEFVGREGEKEGIGAESPLESEKISISDQKITFRDYEWGTDLDEIAEKEVTSDMVSGKDYLLTDSALAILNGNVGGYDAAIVFMGDSGRLENGTYTLTERHTNEQDYYNDYLDLVSKYTKVYGTPILDRAEWKDDYYRDRPGKEGMAAITGDVSFFTAWVGQDGSFVSISFSGDNYEPNTIIVYSSEISEPEEDLSGI